MESVSLSVVMPVFNEASYLPSTIDALVTALEGSGFDAELVVVDDGSTDASAEVARAIGDGRLPVRIVSQPNSGRFAARRNGLSAATGDFVLLLDARVRLAPEALRFVRASIDDEDVWNAHVEVDDGNAFGAFWRLLAELAWRDYFDNPRTTSFGAAEFDRFPKGTTCFLAPRPLLESSFAQFDTRYGDVRLANDDTPMLRALATRRRIAISPRFGCVYSPRTTLRSFVRHSYRRGIVFVDGHGRPESRFFPFVVAFFPLSAAFALAALRRPAVLPASLIGCGVAAAAYGLHARRPPSDLRTLALVTPLYALGHGAGMWRGALELLR